MRYDTHAHAHALFARSLQECLCRASARRGSRARCCAASSRPPAPRAPGLLTPSDVAERLLAFLARHNERERWLSACRADDVRSQAAAATARYKAGAPLSVFDGAPFVVKDSIDALPYPTTFGTRFMGDL